MKSTASARRFFSAQLGMDTFKEDPPESIQRFLYSYIDSAEQLEFLLWLHARPGHPCSMQQLSQEFRTSLGAARARLESLEELGFVRRELGTPDCFVYIVQDPEREAMVRELGERYRGQRHRILQLIFSPLKNARHLADAFRLCRGRGENEGGEDG